MNKITKYKKLSYKYQKRVRNTKSVNVKYITLYCEQVVITIRVDIHR